MSIFQDQDQNLDLSSLRENEVVFFIRIRGKKSSFKAFYPPNFLRKFSKITHFRTISEYKKDADFYIDLKKYDYRDISFQEKLLIQKILPIPEIIIRCRGLRSISYHEAYILVFRCAKFFIEFFKINKIKLLVGLCVDNYVTDIMFRFCDYYNIKILSTTDYLFYPKYKLLTKYGEHNNYRSPSSEEIEFIYNSLLNKQKSPLAISKIKSIKNAFWDFGSFYYKYFFRYLLGHKILKNISYEYKFAKYFKKFYCLGQLKGIFYLKKLDLNKIKNKSKYVYVPLHYYPEATIDYWTDSCEKFNYYCQLFDVIKFFEEKNITLLIKEHPAFFLAREVWVYKEIKKYSNTILVSPFVSTQDILDVVDDIVVWNGSTGIESIILNKNIYITTESYYSNKKLPHYTEYPNPRPFSEEEKKDLIGHILSTSLKVDE